MQDFGPTEITQSPTKDRTRRGQLVGEVGFRSGDQPKAQSTCLTSFQAILLPNRSDAERRGFVLRDEYHSRFFLQLHTKRQQKLKLAAFDGG